MSERSGNWGEKWRSGICIEGIQDKNNQEQGKNYPAKFKA